MDQEISRTDKAIEAYSELDRLRQSGRIGDETHARATRYVDGMAAIPFSALNYDQARRMAKHLISQAHASGNWFEIVEHLATLKGVMQNEMARDAQLMKTETVPVPLSPEWIKAGHAHLESLGEQPQADGGATVDRAGYALNCSPAEFAASLADCQRQLAELQCEIDQLREEHR